MNTVWMGGWEPDAAEVHQMATQALRSIPVESFEDVRRRAAAVASMYVNDVAELRQRAAEAASLFKRMEADDLQRVAAALDFVAVLPVARRREASARCCSLCSAYGPVGFGFRPCGEVRS